MFLFPFSLFFNPFFLPLKSLFCEVPALEVGVIEAAVVPVVFRPQCFLVKLQIYDWTFIPLPQDALVSVDVGNLFVHKLDAPHIKLAIGKVPNVFAVAWPDL